jgi:hypothetical protein
MNKNQTRTDPLASYLKRKPGLAAYVKRSRIKAARRDAREQAEANRIGQSFLSDNSAATREHRVCRLDGGRFRHQ